jgi:ribonuclease HII
MRLNLPLHQETIVRGDSKCLSIAAASIVAKVVRDIAMLKFDGAYSQYGFRQHKGYGTQKHMAALKIFGPCPIHRRSFAPIK